MKTSAVKQSSSVHVASAALRQMDYRAAVALNNMAVSMLEKGCYSQGFETLKDAVSVMKVVVRRQEQPEVKFMMQKAHYRAAQPHKSEYESLPSFGRREETCLNHDEQDVPFLTACNLVRLEIEAESLLDLSEEDVDLSVTTVLYNMGIAHLCQSQVLAAESRGQQNAPVAAKALQKAGFRILASCANLLQSRRREILADCEDRGGDPFLLVRVLALSAIVYDGWSRALQALGGRDDEQASLLIESSTAMRVAVKGIKSRFFWCCSGASVAPAA